MNASREKLPTSPHELFPTDVVTGNVFDKYRSTNALHRWLMSHFLATALSLLDECEFRKVIEVGCGPGDLAQHMFLRDGQPSCEYQGVDIGPDQVALARARYPTLCFNVASAYRLPAEDASCELVVACEVLEHLEDPEAALEEMHRVAAGTLLLSVPQEPLWRLLNMARGKYLRRFGNTPGHVQHFSRRGIVALVNRQFTVVSIRTPFPWTMLLAKKGP